MANLQKLYTKWRQAGEDSELTFTFDCGEAASREDFSNFADLEETICFEDMLTLENNHN